MGEINMSYINQTNGRIHEFKYSNNNQIEWWHYSIIRIGPFSRKFVQMSGVFVRIMLSNLFLAMTLKSYSCFIKKIRMLETSLNRIYGNSDKMQLKFEHFLALFE